MTKQKQETKPTTIVTVAGREIELFVTQDELSPAQALPHGICQMEAIQVKFNEPGQSVHGQYLGCSTNTSKYKQQPTYCFHELKLPSGVIIGFCGCSQLDKTLLKVHPCKYDVHIAFSGYKDLPNGQRFKCFHIFNKLHPCETYPPDRPSYDEFGDLVGEKTEPVVVSETGKVRPDPVNEDGEAV